MTPFETLLAFLIAQALVGAVLPGPRRRLPFLWHYTNRVTRALEKRLNRRKRGAGAQAFRGFLLLTLALLFSGCLGVVIGRIHADIPHGHWVDILVLAFCITITTPPRILRRMQKHFKNNDVQGMRAVLEPFVPQVASLQDEHAIARHAVEFAAWGMNRCFVGPVFWYLVLGPFGLVFSTLVAAMDHVTGHKEDRFLAFGSTIAVMDTILNLIPARLTGFLLVLGSVFTPRAKLWAAARVMLTQSRRLKAINAGWPLAAMAGATGLALVGKPVWLGDEGGTARARAEDLRTVCWLFEIAVFVVIAVLGLFYARYGI